MRKQRAAGLRILSQDALLPCLVYPDALPFTRPPKPCMNSRAHRRTRARHDTSGLGTVIRISLSVFRQVRRRTRSHPGSTPHAPPKRLKHPVDPPCGRAGPRFASTTTRLAPRRARPRGGRVHRGVALSRTASTKERTASTDSELLRAYPYIWAYKRSCGTPRRSSRTSMRVLRGTGANLPSTPRSLK